MGEIIQRVNGRVCNVDLMRKRLGPNKERFQALVSGLGAYAGTHAFHEAMQRNLGLAPGRSVTVPFALKSNLLADTAGKALLDRIPQHEWATNFSKRTDLINLLNRYTESEVRVIFLGKSDAKLQSAHTKEKRMRPNSYYIDTALKDLQGIAILAGRTNVLEHDDIFANLIPQNR